MSTIELPIRYYRHYVDPAEPNDEAHLAHVHDTIPLPLEHTALVLVDCWNTHHNDGVVERMQPVLEDHIAPVLERLRETEATVVHCPSRDVASRYPAWTKYANDRDLALVDRAKPDAIDWPPAAFTESLAYPGPEDPAALAYPEYAKMHEPRAGHPWTHIHDAVAPAPGADEFVVATGRQLHRLLAHRELLHLVYVGFHTNICVRNRPYGIEAMAGRGYNPILLRDCTQAIESHDTLEEELHKQIAIREMETGTCVTSTGAELLRGPTH